MPRFILEPDYAIVALRGLNEFSSVSVRNVFQHFMRCVEESAVAAVFLCNSTYGLEDECHDVALPGGGRQPACAGNLNFVASQVAAVGRPVLGLACGQVDEVSYRLLKHTDCIFATESCYFTFSVSLHDGTFVHGLGQTGDRVHGLDEQHGKNTKIPARLAEHLGLVRAVIGPGEWNKAFNIHVADCANGTTPAMPSRLKYGPVRLPGRLVDHPRRPPQGHQDPQKGQSHFPSMFFQPPPKKTYVQADPADRTPPAAHPWPTLVDGQAITTVMIRSLPPSVTMVELMASLDSNGLRDKYDFVHIPFGGKPSTAACGNLGYGFVNFIEPEGAIECAAIFTNSAFFATEAKVCSVHPAVKQGRAANVAHIMRFANLHPSRRPFVRAPADESVQECDVSTDVGSEEPGGPESSNAPSERGGMTLDRSHEAHSSQDGNDLNADDGAQQPDLAPGFAVPLFHPDVMEYVRPARRGPGPIVGQTAVYDVVSGLELVHETL